MALLFFQRIGTEFVEAPDNEPVEKDPSMNIVVYAHAENPSYQRLNHAIASLALGRQQEVYGKVSLFLQRFRIMGQHPDIIIIMPDAQEELDTLIHHRELFESTRTIVILPKREDAILSQGHKLRPSFMTFSDGDFGEIAAILEHLNLTQGNGHSLYNA